MTITDPTLIAENDLTKVIALVRLHVKRKPRSLVRAIIAALGSCHDTMMGTGSDYAGNTTRRGPWEATVCWNRYTSRIDINAYLKISI